MNAGGLPQGERAGRTCGVPFDWWLHGSLYLMILIAATSLWLGEDEPWPYLWPVCWLAIVAFVFTDLWDRFAIGTHAASLLAVAATAAIGYEEYYKYAIDPVIPLGHWLLLFLCIFFFQVKDLRRLRTMYFMSLLIMVMAAIHNNRPTFGLLVALYTVAAYVTASRLNLAQSTPAPQRPAEPAADRPPRAPKLELPLGLLSSGLAVVLVGLAAYLLLPRSVPGQWVRPEAGPLPLLLTGLDETVELGSMGSILESNKQVMKVRLYDQLGRPYRPEQEPLWRGMTLIRYEAGKWHRWTAGQWQRGPWLPRDSWPSRYVRQEVELEPLEASVLFALRPVFDLTLSRGPRVEMIRLDASIVRPPHLLTQRIKYTAISGTDAAAEQPSEMDPRHELRNFRDLTSVPLPLIEPLDNYLIQHRLLPPGCDTVGEVARLRRSMLFGLRRGDPEAGRLARQLCQKVLRHLRDSGRFTYTLEDIPIDPSIDPVLDFLINRRAGHCEYFASAMALLLRRLGMPTRMVTGYKGGDWVAEGSGGYYLVREKHAHAWVEALVVSPRSGWPRWITLDPTSAEQRQRVVATVSDRLPLTERLRRMARTFWFTYVLNYSAVQQERAVYGPIRDAVNAVAFAAADLMDRHVPGGVDTVTYAAWACSAAAFLLAGLLRLLRSRPRLRRKLGRILFALVPWLAGKLQALVSARGGFYQDMLELLAELGLQKPPQLTPRQFAFAAAELLRAQPATQPVATVPARIVELFYRVRFGHHPLSDRELKEVHELLERLAEAIGNSG